VLQHQNLISGLLHPNPPPRSGGFNIEGLFYGVQDAVISSENLTESPTSAHLDADVTFPDRASVTPPHVLIPIQVTRVSDGVDDAIIGCEDFMIRQKKSWVDSGSGSLPSE
jgi:hypothetical protein